MTTAPQPEPCKHCPDLIERVPIGGDYLHTTGPQAGMHRCAVSPYGYHAEPVGSACRADGPNPCLGARGGVLPSATNIPAAIREALDR